MADFGSRRGVANLGLPLMLLTFLLFGGFMYWLYATAEPTQPAVVEEVEERPGETESGAETVDPQALKTGAAAFEGQLVRLQNLSVSQMVGSEAFFVDLPATADQPSQPFLVRMSPDLSATGATVALNDRATIVGSLLPMTDSIVADWVENGIVSPGEQVLVEFSTHFIEADQVITAEESGEGSSGS